MSFISIVLSLSILVLRLKPKCLYGSVQNNSIHINEHFNVKYVFF